MVLCTLISPYWEYNSNYQRERKYLTFFIMATKFSVIGDKLIITPAGICVCRDDFEIMSILFIYVSYRLLSSEVDAIASSMCSHLLEEVPFLFNLNVSVQEHYIIRS